MAKKKVINRGHRTISRCARPSPICLVKSSLLPPLSLYILPKLPQQVSRPQPPINRCIVNFNLRRLMDDNRTTKKKTVGGWWLIFLLFPSGRTGLTSSIRTSGTAPNYKDADRHATGFSGDSSFLLVRDISDRLKGKFIERCR